MILTDSQRNELVCRLREGVQPRAVFLFGSQASRSAREATSDVDLCVIVADSTENVYGETVRAYRALRGMPFAKDIVVRRESDFEQRSRWLNSLEAEIQQSGQRLYQA